MELRDYIQVARRRWTWIVACTVLVAAAAAVFTFLQTPQYESTTRLFVSTTDSEQATVYQGGLFSAQRVQSYADLVSSRELAATVIDELDLDIDPAALGEKVNARVVPETVNLTIAVRDPDPAEAQRIAQAYAEGLTAMIRDLETPPGQQQPPIKATIVDAASFSTSPVAPQPIRNLGLGLVLGLLLGAGVAVLRELLDNRVTTQVDLQQEFGGAELGAIGFDPEVAKRPLLTDIDSHAPRSEAFRMLRTNLRFVDVDNPQKAFSVSSAVPEEGKTSTAVNLAISLAQAGMRTLLLEGDLRRPRATAVLGLDGAIGVTNVLLGTIKAADAVQRHEPSGLDVLASGPVPPNPAELIQSQAMSDLLTDLRASYDIVIIDSPPLLPVTDAALLSTRVDGTLLVVRHRHVTRDQVGHALERLRQVGGPFVGFVRTMTPTKSRGYGYGYGYGYSSGYAPLAGRRRAE